MYPIPRRTLLPRSLPLLWFLSFAIALGSLRFLIADIAVVMQPMLHHVVDRPIPLYAHIGFAPVALALLPFQFSRKLRAARPGLHRWFGRMYGLSILIAGIGGIIIGLKTEEGAIAASGLVSLGVFWLGTTAYAIWLAIQRDIAAHRRWMIRSAALTLSAVTLRLYLPLGVMTVGFDAAYPVICWMCWVPNLWFAEWWLGKAAQTTHA